jgi:hypothetical protein
MMFTTITTEQAEAMRRVSSQPDLQLEYFS